MYVPDGEISDEPSVLIMASSPHKNTMSVVSGWSVGKSILNLQLASIGKLNDTRKLSIEVSSTVDTLSYLNKDTESKAAKVVT